MKVHSYLIIIVFYTIKVASGIDIPDIPLEVIVKSPPPIIMFLIDDSSSMNSSILVSTENKLLKKYFYVFDDAENNVFSSLTTLTAVVPPEKKESWQARCPKYNKLYYNPNKTYTPWPYWSDMQEELNHTNADLNCPRYNPFKSKCLNLDGIYLKNDFIQISFSHFFSFKDINSNEILDSDETLFLVEISGEKKQILAHRFINPELGFVKNNLEQILISQLPEGVLASIAGEPVTYTRQRQNFANWFSFYRRKELVIKNQIACLIDKIEGFIGFYSFNQSITLPVQHLDYSEKVLTETKKRILEQVYTYSSFGDSSLRKSYQAIGNYMDSESKSSIIGNSPFIQHTEGDKCRNAFVIVFTDGYYNGPSPDVGNCDIEGGAIDSLFDGQHYGDPFENTFADVSMYYYERDLVPGIPNNVPAIDSNTATHQHLVPIIIVFDSKNFPINTKEMNLQWLKPKLETEELSLDLYHAAINGRGFFASTDDPFELKDIILQIDGYIQKTQSVISGIKQVGSNVQGNSQIIETSYSSINWTGDIKSYDISKIPKIPKWSAKAKLEQKSENDRHIFSFNGEKGIPFRKEFLGTEFSSNQIKSIRNLPLGDIVHSEPVIVKNTVWIGSNDGMLHGFDVNTGIEKLAYIPKMVWPRLNLLIDNILEHKYFIDGNIYAYEDNNQTLLCATLGFGGKGVFCLNLSDIPENIAHDDSEIASKLALWEYSPAYDRNLGHVQNAYIVKSNYKNRPVVIFGNGYNSYDKKAFLYILDAQTARPLILEGKSWKKGIDIPYTGSDNGLSTPALIDIDNNNTVDFIYAGDLNGNLWKIDCRSTNPNEWRVAYEEEFSKQPKPLFQALSSTGDEQPITIRPEVIRHCDSRFMGYLVIFGTGKYIEKKDVLNKNYQSLYAIWDWEEYWRVQKNENLSKVRNRYLGSFNKTSGLSEKRKTDNTPDHIFLFKQNIDQCTSSESSSSINWNPEADQAFVGWYIDLNPNSGERIITPLTYLNDNILLFITFTPADSSCKSGGISNLYVVNVANALNYREIFKSMSEESSLLFKSIDGILHPPIVSYQGNDQLTLLFSSSNLPGISKISLKQNNFFDKNGIFDRKVFYWKTY